MKAGPYNFSVSLRLRCYITFNYVPVMGISLTNYQRSLQCWDNANFPGTSSSYNKSINQRDYSITKMLAFKLAERDRRHTTIRARRSPRSSTFTGVLSAA